MKASDTKRAMILVEARRTLNRDVNKAINKRAEPLSTWDFYGMRLGVADIGIGGNDDFGGVNEQAWVDIDVVTARLLIPLLRNLIDDELRKLGVKQ